MYINAKHAIMFVYSVVTLTVYNGFIHNKTVDSDGEIITTTMSFMHTLLTKRDEYYIHNLIHGNGVIGMRTCEWELKTTITQFIAY